MGVEKQVFSEKTMELVIYISSKLQDKPKYGATMLGKAICLSDFLSYLQLGKPITDLTYIKQDFGPTPKPREFLPLRNQLIDNKDAEIREVYYYGLKQHKLIPKRAPRLDLFSKEEIVLIDSVIEDIGDKNAVDISEFTHRFLAWNFADDKEEMPLFSFLLTSTEPEQEDIQWAIEVDKKYSAS